MSAFDTTAALAKAVEALEMLDESYTQLAASFVLSQLRLIDLVNERYRSRLQEVLPSERDILDSERLSYVEPLAAEMCALPPRVLRDVVLYLSDLGLVELGPVGDISEDVLAELQDEAGLDELDPRDVFGMAFTITERGRIRPRH